MAHRCRARQITARRLHPECGHPCRQPVWNLLVPTSSTSSDSDHRQQAPGATAESRDTRRMWSPGHPLQSSIQAPTEQQLGAPGQHQEDSYPFNPGGWKLQQDAVHLCKDEPPTHTWSKGEPIPLKRVQAPNGSRPGEEATLNPHSGPPGELHEPSTQYQGGVLRGSVTTVSSHLDPQPPGHLAQRANNPEPGRLLTVQQDAGDSKFGTFNYLTPMTTAWLPVIILFILSICASLSFLHCPSALGVFTRIRNSAPS